MWLLTNIARQSWSVWKKSARKLETQKEEFEEFLAELHRAKDKEEFDRFMAARHNANHHGPAGGAGPDTSYQG